MRINGPLGGRDGSYINCSSSIGACMQASNSNSNYVHVHDLVHLPGSSIITENSNRSLSNSRNLYDSSFDSFNFKFINEICVSSRLSCEDCSKLFGPILSEDFINSISVLKADGGEVFNSIVIHDDSPRGAVRSLPSADVPLSAIFEGGRHYGQRYRKLN